MGRLDDRVAIVTGAGRDAVGRSCGAAHGDRGVDGNSLDVMQLIFLTSTTADRVVQFAGQATASSVSTPRRPAACPTPLEHSGADRVEIDMTGNQGEIVRDFRPTDLHGR